MCLIIIGHFFFKPYGACNLWIVKYIWKLELRDITCSHIIKFRYILHKDNHIYLINAINLHFRIIVCIYFQ